MKRLKCRWNRSRRTDLWKDQEFHLEVWVEKDALVDVVQKACDPMRVNYFSCRGYTSQTAVYWAAKRLAMRVATGKQPIIIHLGDHDPSGVDMSRDIADRFEMFTGRVLDIERIALNMDQIEEYEPPPNPAKETDSRYKRYARQYGADCWELDAMDVRVIHQLISDSIERYRDVAQWETDEAIEKEQKEGLSKCSDRWADVIAFLNKPVKPPRPKKAKKKKPAKKKK